MLGLLFMALVATFVPVGAARADELVIEGVGLSRDVDCDGKDVGVYGAQNTIALTGACRKVVVHGSAHTVSFEKAATLQVSGVNHKVTGGAVQDLLVSVSENAVTATLGGAGTTGTLDVNGAGNRVSLILAGPSTLTVAGADHTVEWSRADGVPNPEVNARGVKNTLRRKP